MAPAFPRQLMKPRSGHSLIMGVYFWKRRTYLIPAISGPRAWRLRSPQTSSFLVPSSLSAKPAERFAILQSSSPPPSGLVSLSLLNRGAVSCASFSSSYFLSSRGMASIMNGMQCDAGFEKGKGLVSKCSDEILDAMRRNVDVEEVSFQAINKDKDEIAIEVERYLSVEKKMGIEVVVNGDESPNGMQCNAALKKLKGLMDAGTDEALSGRVKVNEKNNDGIEKSNFEVETGKRKNDGNNDEMASETHCNMGIQKENGTVDKNSDEEIHKVVALLRQCAKRKDLSTGNKLHLEIAEKGMLRMNPAVGNSLMDMYAKCGRLEKAQNVFDSLPTQSVASWTVLISAYVQHGHGQMALTRYQQMLSSGLFPNAVTFACILKACGSTGALEFGEGIHRQIAKYGLLDKDIVLANSLVQMYAKAGALPKAQKVFDNLRVKPLESWTSLISGYTQHGNSEAALRCYRDMQSYGTSPNVVTFVCILKACGNLGASNVGQGIHEQIEKEHLLEKNVVVGNALVDMYAKCGLLKKAEEVFQKLPMRNVISWTTLIAGYVQHGYGLEALSCFNQMQMHQVYPNAVTLVCALKACGYVRALSKGTEIHGWIRRDVVLQKNSLVIGALIYMYTKCTMVELAREVFNTSKACIRDITLWTTLIVGHVQNGCYEEALDLFEEMIQEGQSPNAATYSSILKACGVIGAAEKGQALFIGIANRNLLKEDMVLNNSALDMYARTGWHEKAHDLFADLPCRDLASWNTLVSGNAHLGEHENVVSLFNQLITGGLVPDSTSFTLLLVSCNNAGLVDEAQCCFEKLSNGSYGITPTLEHHVSIVDLLGRAGQAEKAAIVFAQMPFATQLTSWYAVMRDCHKWSNLGI